MALILNIETSSYVCSVALSKDGKLVNLMEDKEGRSHASMLAVLIDRILKEQQVELKELDAVAISKGPGSYTGLRIGVSTAKGLCYGAALPLIGVHTIQALAQGLINQSEKLVPGGLKDNDRLVPLIDARRMEVYTATLNKNNNFLTDVTPKILDENSFSEELEKHRLVFFGDGVAKTRRVINHPNALFVEEIDFSAQHMIPVSEKRFVKKEFEDVAYFEPFYLKDFQTTKPRNKFF